LLVYKRTIMQQTGKYIIVVGALIVLIGLLIYLFGNKLHWIGRLPGDIRIEKENVRFYFPLTTMILFSVLLTIIVNLVRRFL
jgi:hypothetical protein